MAKNSKVPHREEGRAWVSARLQGTCSPSSCPESPKHTQLSGTLEEGQTCGPFTDANRNCSLKWPLGLSHENQAEEDQRRRAPDLQV